MDYVPAPKGQFRKINRSILKYLKVKVTREVD